MGGNCSSRTTKNIADVKNTIEFLYDPSIHAKEKSSSKFLNRNISPKIFCSS